MDAILVPWGLSLWDFFIFDLGLTLLIELPFMKRFLGYNFYEGTLFLLLANLASALCGIALALLPSLPWIESSMLFTYLTVDAWGLVSSFPPTLLLLTIIVELGFLLLLTALKKPKTSTPAPDWRRVVQCGILMNLCSWPLLFIAMILIQNLASLAWAINFTLFPLLFDGAILLCLGIGLYGLHQKFFIALSPPRK